MNDICPLSMGIAASVILLVTLMANGWSDSDGADFYVSKDGDDSYSGRLAQPENTDGPFATVQRAMKAVRQLRQAEKLDEPITVMLRDGTYRLTEPLTFGPQDSGTEQTPVTYAAYPDETPILSGGRKITGWEKGDGDLWRVHLPKVQAGDWQFRQLFVNGHRRQRARTPNEGWHRLKMVKPNNRKAPINRKAFRFEAGDINANWTNLRDVEIVKLFGWSETRLPIESVNEDDNICHCAGVCSRSGRRPFKWYGRRYFVENVFEALDTPGEWYLNRETGMLYYWPMPDENIEEADVVAPAVEYLVNLAGDVDLGAYCEHIAFRGLRFMHSGAAFPENGYPEKQSDVFVPGAIRGTAVRNCRIENCEIAHVGTYAIELAAGSKHNAIVHNELHDIGAGGIKIDGPRNPESDAEGTSHTTVTDNDIHDAGHIYFGGTGIWAGHSGHNTIAHNAVHDMYGMGISVGWTWAYKLTPAHHNIVEYNHVYDLGHGKVGASSGLYTLARQPGTKLRCNLVHDINKYTGGRTHPTFGIQVDNGSGEIVYEKNIVYNVPDACWKQFGKKHVVRNNIFAFANGYEILRRHDEGSVTIEHNIILSDDGKIYGDSWDKQNFEADNNLYWDNSDEELDFGGKSFQKWQELGNDTHSVIADPGFADAKNGDFSLPEDSPAFDVGFEVIDVSKVGPRERGSDRAGR